MQDITLSYIILSFILSIFSGAIAGFVAGIVLLQKQVHTQNEKEDIDLLKDYFIKLERAYLEFGGFLTFKENYEERGSWDEDIERSINEIELIIEEIADVTLKLKSKKYMILRNCFQIFRDKYITEWSIENSKEIEQKIELILSLIDYHIKFKNITVKNLFNIKRYNKTRKLMKKLLTGAAYWDGKINISHQGLISPFPGKLSEWTLENSKKYISILAKLEEYKLINKIKENHYSLTFEGWIVASKNWKPQDWYDKLDTKLLNVV